MKWEFLRRASGLIEAVCEHGVGHPVWESIKQMEEATGDSTWGIHGCCGCCSREDFPKEYPKEK